MNQNRQHCPRRKERPQSDIPLNKESPKLPRQIGIPLRMRVFVTGFEGNYIMSCTLWT